MDGAGDSRARPFHPKLSVFAHSNSSQLDRSRFTELDEDLSVKLTAGACGSLA